MKSKIYILGCVQFFKDQLNGHCNNLVFVAEIT